MLFISNKHINSDFSWPDFAPSIPNFICWRLSAKPLQSILLFALNATLSSKREEGSNAEDEAG
jgi:hypothetical protein